MKEIRPPPIKEKPPRQEQLLCFYSTPFNHFYQFNCMTSNTLQNILHRLKNVRRSGDCYIARCPNHDDRRNSLSIGEGHDGRVLIFCHAGCDVREVVAALDLTVNDLFTYEKE